MSCFLRKNQKKIKFCTFGAGFGPLGGACSSKIGPEALKAEKAGVGENGRLGGQNRSKTKKKFFFGESKVSAFV